MKKFFLLALALIILAPHWASAQTTQYRFMSAYIYQFAKNVEWPAVQTSQEITIGILGDERLTKEWQTTLGNKQIGGRRFALRTLKATDDLTSYNILFIPLTSGHDAAALQVILEMMQDSPTLLITEKDGLFHAHSIISFIEMDGILKFELNKAAAQRAGLKISDELLHAALAH